MTSPVLEAHAALRSALLASTAVTDIIGQRVYDRVPEKPQFPYIVIDAGVASSEDAACIVATQQNFDVHVWSRVEGSGELYNAADAAKRALHFQGVSITDNAIGDVVVQSTRFLDDPDGLTRQAILSITTILEER